MLTEYAAKKILDTALKRLSDLGQSPETRVIADITGLSEALHHHSSAAASWAQEISFRDLAQPRDLSISYVELDVFITPQRLHVDDKEQQNKLPFLQVITDLSRHLVLLGPPGSGKSTSLKRVYLSFIRDDESTRRFDIAIVIRLREIQTRVSNPLLVELAGELGIRFAFLESDDHAYREAIVERTVVACIEGLKAILLIDGFDELLPELRSPVAEDLIRLSLGLRNSLLIVTSRSADFQVTLPNSLAYEIAPMTDDQVASFCSAFLGEPNSAERFLRLLNESPYFDTRINPLNLAHLCAIFERIGGIPEKPRTVYRKLINLSLEEWDQQKPVNRSSKYSNFEVDRKRDFLARLAFDLTTRKGGASFSRADLYGSPRLGVGRQGAVSG